MKMQSQFPIETSQFMSPINPFIYQPYCKSQLTIHGAISTPINRHYVVLRIQAARPTTLKSKIEFADRKVRRTSYSMQPHAAPRDRTSSGF